MDVRLVTDGESRTVPDELAELLRRDTGFWVDIPSCDEDAVSVLSEVFGFHPMAVRACFERNRVPKVHGYPDHVFVVLHAPERGQRGHVHYIELDQFVGRNYLVTVHGPINPAVDPAVALRETSAVLTRIEAGRLRPSRFRAVARDRLRAHPPPGSLRRDHDPRRVAAGAAGHRRAGRQSRGFLTELFRARHGLLAVRTMAALGGAIYGRMSCLTRIPPGGHRLVADIMDQFERVRSVADGEKEYLQGVIEFYQTVLTINAVLVGQAQNVEVKRLTEASYAQNEEIKKISAWAAIFFAPTLIGTVYGMNFDHMPELHWRFGYPAAVILMLLLSVALYVLFRRRRWL